MIENIRERFLNEYQNNPELYHEIDVNRVRNDNWQIERFIGSDGNEDNAFDSLIKAMKWKKCFGVHERTDQYFPKELFELNKSEVYGRDKDGRVICWGLGRSAHTFPEIQDLYIKYVIHEIEKLNTMASKDGYIMITDTRGMGLSNINLDKDLNKFLQQVIHSYYPKGMRYNIVVNLPWILSSAFKLVLSFMSQEYRNLVKFINKEEIVDFVDIEYIPIYLGGKREVREKIIPEGVLALDQSPHLGLTDKQIKSFYEKYNKICNNI